MSDRGSLALRHERPARALKRVLSFGTPFPTDGDPSPVGDRGSNDVDPREFPLIRVPERRVNVGVELLDYRPASLAWVVGLLDACEREERRVVRDRAAAAELL